MISIHWLSGFLFQVAESWLYTSYSLPYSGKYSNYEHKPIKNTCQANLHPQNCSKSTSKHLLPPLTTNKTVTKIFSLKFLKKANENELPKNSKSFYDGRKFNMLILHVC